LLADVERHEPDRRVPDRTRQHCQPDASRANLRLNLPAVFKYASFVLRAQNDGEGGLFVLIWPAAHSLGLRHPCLAVVPDARRRPAVRRRPHHPAVSILPAVEGLGVASPTLTHLIIPITVLLLTGLFAVQFNGTAGIGRVMLVVGGAEAMYADLGHFGARPIRTGCFAVVYPACRSTCPPTTANGSSTSRPQTCCRPDGWACSAACASACSC
jgi:K+ transporter